MRATLYRLLPMLAAMLAVIVPGFFLLVYVVFPLVLSPVLTTGALLAAVGMALVLGFIASVVGSLVEIRHRR